MSDETPLDPAERRRTPASPSDQHAERQRATPPMAPVIPDYDDDEDEPLIIAPRPAGAHQTAPLIDLDDSPFDAVSPAAPVMPSPVELAVDSDRDDPPLVLAGKPEGAVGWAPATDPIKAPVADGYSAQSQQIIQSLNEALADPSFTDIHAISPSRIATERNGQMGMFAGQAFASDDEYVRWFRSLVETNTGILTWDDIERSYGGVVSLPDGSRLTMYLPPSSVGHATFTLRKHTAHDFTGQDLVRSGAMDERMLSFLRACVASKVNVLVVGDMGSGKTTLLRVLAKEIADDEPIALVEQIPELDISKPLLKAYSYVPFIDELNLATNLDRQLYNGLSRLIVGEVHMTGLQQMLECMILTQGSMSTYHSPSTEMAGERMKVALQLEHPNLTAQTAISYMRLAIDLVVVMRKVDGTRRVMQISEIDWRSTGDTETLAGRDIYKFNRATQAWRGQLRPDSEGRIAQKAADAGIEMPDSWFVEPDDLEAFERRYARR